MHSANQPRVAINACAIGRQNADCIRNGTIRKACRHSLLNIQPALYTTWNRHLHLARNALWRCNASNVGRRQVHQGKDYCVSVKSASRRVQRYSRASCGRRFRCDETSLPDDRLPLNHLLGPRLLLRPKGKDKDKEALGISAAAIVRFGCVIADQSIV